MLATVAAAQILVAFIHFDPCWLLLHAYFDILPLLVYKRLSNLLGTKHGLSYGVVMGWVRCKLGFSLLQSAIMCVRIAQSSLRCPVTEAPIAVQVAEAQI